MLYQFYFKIEQERLFHCRLNATRTPSNTTQKYPWGMPLNLRK